MVTGGEHEYTLEGFRRLIAEGCVDIVQPDIYRAGGLTGLKRVAALARAYQDATRWHKAHPDVADKPEMRPDEPQRHRDTETEKK